MAVLLPSVYKDGTATVAANGVAVTGQGTMWLNTVLPGDFFGTHKGSPNRILAVNSNTSLTLAYPWLGGAQATAAYEIMYQSDTARMQETARQLLEKLSSGNVDAFAELIGAADRIPTFTGPGAMDLLVTGAKGRQILASADLIATLAMLGPAGGYAPQPQSAGVGMVNGDFNNLIYPGDYTIASAYTNGVTSAASTSYSGFLEVRVRTGVGMWQTFTSGQVSWERYSATSDGSSWTAWQVVDSYTVGTVSRNTAGEPTGAIIERGSNANGEYVRYADGTQICWAPAGSGSLTSGATDGPAGPLFIGPTKTWTLPIAFSNASTAIGMVTNPRSSNRWGTCIGISASTANFRIFSTVTSASDLAFDAFAIGRWFV